MENDREKSRMTLRFFPQASLRVELPFLKMEKTTRGTVLWEKIGGEDQDLTSRPA